MNQEKSYVKFSEGEIYSHLWYQQTGTPGGTITPNIMLIKKFLFLLMTQTPIQDSLLSVISSSEKKP